MPQPPSSQKATSTSWSLRDPQDFVPGHHVSILAPHWEDRERRAIAAKGSRIGSTACCATGAPTDRPHSRGAVT